MTAAVRISNGICSTSCLRTYYFPHVPPPGGGGVLAIFRMLNMKKLEMLVFAVSLAVRLLLEVLFCGEFQLVLFGLRKDIVYRDSNRISTTNL